MDRIKQICYYKPTLTNPKGRRSRRRGGHKTIGDAEPNRQLFDLYQRSIRQDSSNEPAEYTLNENSIDSSDLKGGDSFQLPQIKSTSNVPSMANTQFKQGFKAGYAT